MNITTEISIDAFAVNEGVTPNYCRDNADKVRWLAWTLGFINKIRPQDEVRQDLNTNSYILKIIF